MEHLIESVAVLQRRLDQADVLSIVIGGLAVSAWGEPRVTRDADLKVLLNRESAHHLLEALGSDYVPLLAEPLQTLQGRGMLFVRDQAGTRLDLLLAETGFDEAAIHRGKNIELMPGQVVRVCSAEDLIILKLIATRGRDQDDARSVIRRQGDKLDDAYVLDWLKQFEQALDDSTLVTTYRQMRGKGK